jgi:hypothetical protein
MDYAIIVDDDQRFNPTYVEGLYAAAAARSVTSWWGRQFHGKSYFNGVPKGWQLSAGERRDITEFDYVGEASCRAQ